MSTKTKEEILKEGLKVWEEDQKTNPTIVNPNAFTYGYLYGVKSKEQEPIEFTKWCVNHATTNEMGETEWIDNEQNEYSTEQLYELFIKSKAL